MWRRCGNMESYLYYPWKNADWEHCGVRHNWKVSHPPEESCAAQLEWPEDYSLPDGVTMDMFDEIEWPVADPFLNATANEWIDVRMYVKLNTVGKPHLTQLLCMIVFHAKTGP